MNATADTLRNETAVDLELALPHLSINGMSLSWLLKRCGALHWHRIGGLLNRLPQEIVDGKGRRLYPSFIAVRITGKNTAAFSEGDHVQLDSRLVPLSACRVFSSHTLKSPLSSEITVDMLSTLLRRNGSGNAALVGARTGVFFDPCDLWDQEIVASDTRIRSRSWTEHKNFENPPRKTVFEWRFTPSPWTDFNGVGLLYFAAYNEIVDRAEWAFHRDLDLINSSISERELFYFANLNLGDDVVVKLFDFAACESTVSYRAAMYRASDQALMAEVFTKKRICQRSGKSQSDIKPLTRGFEEEHG